MTPPERRFEEARVVVCLPRPEANPCGHEARTQHALAREIAALCDWPFGGEYEADKHRRARPYFVPGDTLDAGAADKLGVNAACDLFGGVVPAAFVATKVISHPLVHSGATAPAGWSSLFAEQVRGVTLPGFTAFSLGDALIAGRRLLAQGSVRLKLATGVGGLGQSVAADAGALEAVLTELEAAGGLGQGVVLEPNLEQIETYSVGRVQVGGLVASYYGRQRQTANNRGAQVYGGSDLVVVRGEFEALLERSVPVHLRMALEQASAYHAAALRAYPGLYASRCNYDVARGYDQSGRLYGGVLEQSWRAGGASGAELAALHAFRSEPGRQLVRASTTEVYGEAPGLPQGAWVYFSGTDPRAGPLTKYARVEGFDEEGYDDDAR